MNSYIHTDKTIVVPATNIFRLSIFTRWLEGCLLRTRLPLPGSSRRTEDLVTTDRLSGVGATTGTVQGVADNVGTPVVRHGFAGELNAEEEDNGAQRKTNVPGGRKDVVVLHPPTAVFVTDQLVESITDEDPRKL